MKNSLNKNGIEEVLIAQKNEITEYNIYLKLADSIKGKNKEILKNIANDELKHYRLWKKYTKKEVMPSKWNIWKYYLISRIFGLTFGVKLMEKGEKNAQIAYDRISNIVNEAKGVEKEEKEHEKQLIGMIDEERLRYVSSVVLGLNDALVELTGALAGFTLALQ